MTLLRRWSAPTFRYGKGVKPGETHVQWLRIGGHEILFSSGLASVVKTSSANPCRPSRPPALFRCM